jgi:hypothetical protein
VASSFVAETGTDQIKGASRCMVEAAKAGTPPEGKRGVQKHPEQRQDEVGRVNGEDDLIMAKSESTLAYASSTFEDPCDNSACLQHR